MARKAKPAPSRRPSADERIDESIEESFPASDPPTHSGAVAGGPRRDGTPRRKAGFDRAKR